MLLLLLVRSHDPHVVITFMGGVPQLSGPLHGTVKMSADSVCLLLSALPVFLLPVFAFASCLLHGFKSPYLTLYQQPNLTPGLWHFESCHVAENVHHCQPMLLSGCVLLLIRPGLQPRTVCSVLLSVACLLAHLFCSSCPNAH